jgi:hypothetical protein
MQLAVARTKLSTKIAAQVCCGSRPAMPGLQFLFHARWPGQQQIGDVAARNHQQHRDRTH